MKHIVAALSLVCFTTLFTSCGGPSRTELRMELQAIDQEMMQLNMIAYNLRSQMNEAEWQSFFGSFAAGFGTVRGDGQLALQGTGTAINAAGNYDRANYNLRQIQSRWNALQKRRMEIMKRLR